MLAIIALLQSAALPATVGWRTERDQVTCRISRDVPTSDHAERISISRDMTSSILQVVIVIPKTTTVTDRSRLAIAGANGAEKSVLTFKAGRLADGRTLLEFDTPVDFDAALPLILDDRPLAVAGADIASLRSRLSRCRDDQLREQGIDAASVSDTLQPPVGTDRPWITNDDIRARASSKNRRGYMIWKVMPDGRIDDCRFVISLDDANLDKRICELLTRRGAYERGARDPAGQPVETWDGRWMSVVY